MERKKRIEMIGKFGYWRPILNSVPEAGALPDCATLRTKKTLVFCFFVSHSSSFKQGTKWQKKTSLEQSVPEWSRNLSVPFYIFLNERAGKADRS
jgi:hypothetical protein